MPGRLRPGLPAGRHAGPNTPLHARPRAGAALLAVWAAASIAVAVLAGCAGPARRQIPAPPPLSAESAAHVVLTAMGFLDTPYRRGGNGAGGGGTAAGTNDVNPDGFDCSGFTRHVFERSLGLTLPRTAWDQARASTLNEVGAVNLQPGDLVFFNTLQRPHSHVGIYIGQGRFIHAPRVGTSVRLEDMLGAAGRYWAERFDGARRAPPR